MAIQFTTNDLCSKIKENYSYTGPVQKKVLEVDTNVQNLKKDIEEFHKTVRSLKKYSNGLTTKSKLERQLSKFVKSYNNMKKTSDSITKDNLKNQLTELDEFIGDNKKSLEKVGIKILEDKLNFDEDIFDTAEEKDIESLFVGKDSFISQVNKFMRIMGKSADDTEYDVITRKINKTTHYEKEKLDFVNSLNGLNGVVLRLTDVSQNIQSMDTEQKEVVKEYLTYFKDKYNDALKKSNTNEDIENSFDKMKKLCKENEGNLSSIGLIINNDDGTMNVNITDNDFNNTTFKDAYTYLFANNASFGSSISEYCKNVFDTIIKPDKIGVTIINEYI